MAKPLIVCSHRHAMHGHAKRLEKNFQILAETNLSNSAADVLLEVQGYAYSMDSLKLSKELLDRLPSLKVVALSSTAHDYVDVDLLKSRGIKLGNSATAMTQAVADYALTLLLAGSRQLLSAVRSLKEDDNPPTGSTAPSLQPLSDEVTGSTVGIIGMGNIGYQVAHKLTGFDVKILYKNRKRKSEEEENAVNATFCENLPDLLSQSDYVVLTVPSNPETNKLIGAEQFCLMKKSAYLINVARGAIVDQDALVEALKQGEIRGAALDVTDPEPLPKDHPLLHMPNVVVTPHIAWATYKTKQRLLDVIVGNLMAGIKGEPLPSPVPM